MKYFKKLKAGDTVEIIAPASRCKEEHLQALKQLLESWKLQVRIAPDIFGDDVLCAHDDVQRLEHLVQALNNPQNQAVICARGGYGSMRLIPQLATVKPPEQHKWFMGLSDITALHLFFNQNWHWPTLHAHLSGHIIDDDSIEQVRQLLFGEIDAVVLKGLMPLNVRAEQMQSLQGPVIGGNLTLIQTSTGTNWQLQAADKILILEEVGERGYRVDRMLEHLSQADVLSGVKAVVFGDFTESFEPDGQSLIEPVLTRFAQAASFPVFRLDGVGHGAVNRPVPFGTSATLEQHQGDYLLTIES